MFTYVYTALSDIRLRAGDAMCWELLTFDPAAPLKYQTVHDIWNENK